MRRYISEGDLNSAEVQNIYNDGSLSLHTRSLRYGKLGQGVMVQVGPSLVRGRKTHLKMLRAQTRRKTRLKTSLLVRIVRMTILKVTIKRGKFTNLNLEGYGKLIQDMDEMAADIKKDKVSVDDKEASIVDNDEGLSRSSSTSKVVGPSTVSF